MLTKILVGVDGSATSERAAALGAEIAQKFGAQLLLVHVMPPPPVFSEPSIVVNLAELERGHWEHAQTVLRRATERLATTGLTPATKILAGPASETICEAADTEGADLVVIGSRGRPLVAGMLLGSVSHRLVHLCRKPVLIAH